MGRIRVLSDSLIDRIAAGEVVERPASVVKELVENSLDAGSASVEVLLESGGKKRIRVTDDGCGMDRDDALLAVERHATSKIAAARDLDSIATLGFRGEALSSIAAVSRFTLSTSTADGAGTRIEIAGGRVGDVSLVGLPRGTSLQVDELFFNVPARRKFLRADATELSQCLRWLTRYALARPADRFLLRHGERRLLDAPPADGILARIGQIHGAEFADKLLPVERAGVGVTVRGFAGRPVDALPRKDTQHFFVNGRAVQDRTLSHAVFAAYENTMPRGRHPAVFLMIEIDPGEVDVNVHPRKTEVRFRHQSAVHGLIRDALIEALSAAPAIPTLTDLRPGATGDPSRDDTRAATLRYLETREPSAEPRPWTPRSPSGSRPCAAPGAEPGSRASVPARPGPVLHERGPVAIPLAQFRESYIVAEDGDGLVLVDQHAAHERVLFEEFLRDAETDSVEVQKLMFPVTIELAPHERPVFEDEAGELRRLGFLVEAFGESAVKIDGVPALAAEVEVEELFHELLGEAAEARSARADLEPLRHRWVTTAACKAAIKINHRLTPESMQTLLDRLYSTANPTTCPHGRPILFRLTVDEIERAFRRR